MFINQYKMFKKARWFLFVLLAITIGLYPVMYFLVDRKFGLLSTKSAELLANVFWNAGFYTHIIFGGLALLTGWLQFSASFRNKNLPIHRLLGKIYLVCAVLSAMAGIGIGFFATGGVIAATGFISLGIIWFTTTLKAYFYIREKQVDAHRKWMTFSYAACFAAVTLRLWMPFLIAVFHDFETAYVIVAWLCWVPNLVVAMLMTKQYKETYSTSKTST